MNNPKHDSEQSYRTLLIIWAALVVSQFLFVLMVFLVKPEVFQFDFSKDPLGGNDSMLIVIFAVVGFSSFVMPFSLRKRMQQRAVAVQNVGLVQTALIIGCALSESISLLGVVSAFALNYQYFFVFSAVGIVATILHIPKRSNVYEASFRPKAPK